MEMTTLLAVASAGHGAGRRSLEPISVRVRGGAVLVDGFPFARDSALTGIPMV